MLSFFFKGGVVMYPILLCSMFSLAVFMERLFALRTSRVISPGLFPQVEKLLRNGGLETARELCRTQGSALASILFAGLRHCRKGRERVREALQDEADHQAGKLERFIDSLATIASVSTLLGLLGTIAGMIKIFSVISTQTAVNPPALAEGISEALITTFAGLSVAIPTLVMHRYLQGRLNRLLRAIEEISVNLLELIEDDAEESVR